MYMTESTEDVSGESAGGDASCLRSSSVDGRVWISVLDMGCVVASDITPDADGRAAECARKLAGWESSSPGAA